MHIYFETRNSSYLIRKSSLGDAYAITKLAAFRDSPYNELFQTRYSQTFELTNGEGAFFDTWRTSEIVKIVNLDTSHRPVNLCGVIK